MIDRDTQMQRLSFGQYLQRARLAQRIRLDDLSRATCIGIDNLMRLESDDLAHLPAEVFVAGYIRTYARTVGADPEEALRRYQACRQALQAQAEWEQRRARASRRFWPRLVLAVGVLAGLIAASVYFMAPRGSLPSRVARSPETILPDGAGNDSVAPRPGEAGAERTGDQPLSANPPPDEAVTAQIPPTEVSNGQHSYQLDIWAVKDLWLKALVDDQQAQVYKLKKGDTLHLEALTGINLLIEDSTGVELTLDGVALPVPGKAGQVVNLEIP